MPTVNRRPGEPRRHRDLLRGSWRGQAVVLITATRSAAAPGSKQSRCCWTPGTGSSPTTGAVRQSSQPRPLRLRHLRRRPHTLLEHLNLRDAVLPGLDGTGEVTRYLGRYGSERSQRACSSPDPPTCCRRRNPTGAQPCSTGSPGRAGDTPVWMKGSWTPLACIDTLRHPGQRPAYQASWNLACHASATAAVACHRHLDHASATNCPGSTCPCSVIHGDATRCCAGQDRQPPAGLIKDMHLVVVEAARTPSLETPSRGATRATCSVNGPVIGVWATSACAATAPSCKWTAAGTRRSIRSSTPTARRTSTTPAARRRRRQHLGPWSAILENSGYTPEEARAAALQVLARHPPLDRTRPPLPNGRVPTDDVYSIALLADPRQGSADRPEAARRRRPSSLPRRADPRRPVLIRTDAADRLAGKERRASMIPFDAGPGCPRSGVHHAGLTVSGSPRRAMARRCLPAMAPAE